MQLKNKIFKIVLIGITSVFISTSIGLIILVNSVNPNKYKPLIIASVNDNTGRKLQLDGNISWEIWPNIGLELRQVSLSNPEGFEDKNFIEMQSASVSLNILPLFRNKIVVNDLNIKGLKLNLIQKNNKNNWTFTPTNDVANKSSSVHFELHRFSLTNSDITYHNFDTKTLKEIKNQNFTLDTPSDGGISYNSHTQELNLDQVNFNLNEHLKGTIELNLYNKSKLLYNGNIKLNPFSLNKVLANLNVKPINIENKTILDVVSFSTNFEGNNKSADFSNLILNIAKSKIQGTVKINNIEPLNIQNDLNINQLEASDWTNLSGYKIPMEDIKIRGNFNNVNWGINKMKVNEHLTIKDVTLYGINLQKHIDNAGEIFTIRQFANPLNLLERLYTMMSPSLYTHKDLKQKTNLGNLNTNIELSNGNLSTPGFSLNGPVLRLTNRGLINFNKDYIGYYIYIKIVSITANSLLGSITYPYVIQGNLNNPETGIDKLSLQKQIVDYYTSIGKTSMVQSVKQSTTHLWNKLFH